MSATTYRRGRCVADAFTKIGNATLQDSRLGFDGIGMLCYLLSKPLDWEMRQTQLMKEFGVGREKLQRLVRRLRELGYMRLERVRDERTGAWLGSRIVYYDSPQTHAEIADEGDDDVAEDATEFDVEDAGENVPRSGAGDAGADSASHANPEHVSSPPQPENPSLRGEPENPADGKAGFPVQRKDSYKPLPPKAPPPADGPAAHRAAMSREDRRDVGRDADPFWTPEIAGAWDAFAAAWKIDADEAVERTRRAFARLSDAERVQAIAHADDHRRDCERNGRRRGSARAFLTDRKFAGWASGKLTHPREPVFVREPGPGFPSPAFEAWERRWREENGSRPMYVHFSQALRCRGVYRDTLFPPMRGNADATTTGPPGDSANPGAKPGDETCEIAV